MAFIVPVATAVGGGSMATGAIILASAAATVGAGVISAQEHRRAGKLAQAQSEIDARAEGDAGRQREIERKRLLRRALSSQIAQAGAGGVSFEGSVARAAQLDIDAAAEDLMIDRANTLQRQRGIRSQGRAARVSGNAKAVTTLLDTAGRTLESFGR